MSSITIGRKEDCEIVIEDPTASRVHAQIIIRDKKLYLRDKGSKNGTFFERDNLRKEVTEELEVKPNDQIFFGDAGPFLMEELLAAQKNRLFIKIGGIIVAEPKAEEPPAIVTKSTRAKKFRCPSCGAIVSALNTVCESCHTKL